jgi:hypothetical protein
MAVIQWPAGLPQAIERPSYGEQIPDIAIRTPMDAGPDKVRLGAPAGIRVFTGTMILTSAQMAIFKEFWSETTRDGALPFDFPHPRTMETIEAQFSDEEPKIGVESGTIWTVTYELEAADEVPVIPSSPALLLKGLGFGGASVLLMQGLG